MSTGLFGTAKEKLKRSSSVLATGLLYYLGTSFSRDQTLLFQLYGYGMFFMTFFYTGYQIQGTICEIGQYDTFMTTLSYALGGVLGTLKTAVVINNNKKLTSALEKLKNLQERTDHLEWVRKATWRMSKFMITGITLMTSMMVLYMVQTTIVGRIINDERIFVYGQFHLFNATESPNYELGFAMQCFQACVCFYQYLLPDLLIVGVLFDMCVQFRYLCQCISNMAEDYDLSEGAEETKVGEVNKNNLSQVVPWPRLAKNIKFIVTRHLTITTAVTELEESFNLMLLINFLGNLFIICPAAYHASVMSVGGLTVVTDLVEALDLILQLYIMCYWGNQILIESKRVAEACYNTNFVGKDIRFQKSLALIMLRSQRPVQLTIGKFVVLDVQVFVWIMRTSYTYFMILRRHKQLEAETEKMI